MWIIELLFSFTGRIPRSHWWLGFAVLLAVDIAGFLMFEADQLDLPVDAPLQPPRLATTLFSLLLLFPLTAITVKRFNDRNWPAWLGYAFAAVAAAQLAAMHFGYLLDPFAIHGPELWLYCALLAASLWAIVDNGFLPGTDGPNRYGNDPLQRT